MRRYQTMTLVILMAYAFGRLTTDGIDDAHAYLLNGI